MSLGSLLFVYTLVKQVERNMFVGTILIVRRGLFAIGEWIWLRQNWKQV